jgi:tRNA pseudouridine55 synthase
VVRFGARSATDDIEGPIEEVEVARPPEAEAVREAAARFVGVIEQRPPAFSAMKVGGRRAYKLARQGEVVEMSPRTVQVYSLEVVDYAWPAARLRIECGRGTYIRAIARDLGEALGVGGYLTELRRTFIGPFAVGNAVALDQLSAESLPTHLRAVE